MSDRDQSHCCYEFCPASNIWEKRGWGLQWGERNTARERGKGNGGQDLVSQSLICPFDGCWMGKDLPALCGQILCAGIWGRQGCEVGLEARGVRRDLLPSPTLSGFGPGGDLAVLGF